MSVHPLAVIGSPPEKRGYGPGDPMFGPVLECGVRVSAFVTVDSGAEQPTRIGARSFLMAHAHVGHDAQIGADCELAPGTVIGGHAVLEDGVRCGVGALIRPRVRVGAGARIGMGAVVTKDVPAGEVWIGNPAARLVRPQDAWTGVGQAPWDGRDEWEKWWDTRR